jgi:hypothetical protein
MGCQMSIPFHHLNFKKERMKYLNKNKPQYQDPEQLFSELAASVGTTPETAASPDKPVVMLKRIGTTTYQVSVFVSNTSRETISDKVTRMIKNDIENEVAGI